MMAEKKPTIYADVIEVMRTVGHIAKGQKNANQHFNFRGIDDVMNAFGPALREHGVIACPVFEELSSEFAQAGNKRVHMITVRVTLTFMNAAGESWQAVTALGNAADYGDKGYSKAQSVALRQAYLYLFTLPTNEPDPDTFSYNLTAADPAPRLPDTEDAVIAMIGNAATPVQLMQIREQAIAEQKLTPAISAALEAKQK